MAIAFIVALVLIVLQLIGGGFIFAVVAGVLIACIKGLVKFMEEDTTTKED